MDHSVVQVLSGRDSLEVRDDWCWVAKGELSVLADVQVQAAYVHQSSLLSLLHLPVKPESFGSSSHEAIADLNKI